MRDLPRFPENWRELPRFGEMQISGNLAWISLYSRQISLGNEDNRPDRWRCSPSPNISYGNEEAHGSTTRIGLHRVWSPGFSRQGVAHRSRLNNLRDPGRTRV